MTEPLDALIVVERRLVTPDVVELALEHPDSRPLPAWEPGAHIEIDAGGLRRQYSLCGDPANRNRWRIAVLGVLASRGGSRFVHESLPVGQRVRLLGLRNDFPLRTAARHVFLAGGIGITPLLPMIRACAAAGTEWQLHYGGRNEQSMAYLPELRASYPGRVTTYRQDVEGVVPIAALLADCTDGVAVHCCGPEPMLNACQDVAAELGLQTVHMERFAPKGADAAGLELEFEVELASTGVVHRVPSDKSILDVLLDAGNDIDYSCRAGTCGTCGLGLLDGVPDHRDEVYTEEEQMDDPCLFVCVSRAVSPRLVLDL